MEGVYSIAEVIDDSNKRPDKTIFCLLEKDIDLDSMGFYCVKKFTKAQMKSLNAVGDMVKRNGGLYFTDLDSVAEYLNK
jgi:hypothetical protein